MPAEKTAHAPKVSDSVVTEKTGKKWAQWFSLLDKAGAKKLPHKSIAQIVHEKHGVPGWWSQMITVEYERSRGLREKHQTAAGYSVSATKTMATTVSALYDATADAELRKRWFPRGAFTPSSQTKNKYINGEWKKGRLNVGFYTTGSGKAQIAIQVNKLAAKGDVDRERAAWKTAFSKLQASLEG